MVTAEDRANTYGRDPIGRQIAGWIAKLATQTTMSDRDFVDALLEHANTDSKSTESLFTLRAGVPVPRDPNARGQMWPDAPKAKFKAKWREALAQIVDDPKKAVRTVGPMSAAELARQVLLIPEFSLPDGRLEIRYSLAAPTTELTLHYAVMLLLDSARPYGALLSKCTHRTCGRFFIAVRENARGKVRRDYCSKEHFDDETRMKVAERVRAHRSKKAAKGRKPK